MTAGIGAAYRTCERLIILNTSQYTTVRLDPAGVLRVRINTVPGTRDRKARAIMATTTTPVEFAGHGGTRTETGTKKPGFLTRFFERLIEARIRRAEMQVQPFLAKLSNERLRDLGFTGDDISKLREKHYVQAVYWS